MAATKDSKEQLKVTLTRSMHGRKPGHKECVRGLGLRRMHQTVTVIDTPCNRGLIDKVSYMLNVEKA